MGRSGLAFVLVGAAEAFQQLLRRAPDSFHARPGGRRLRTALERGDEGDVSSLYVRSDPEDVEDVRSVLAQTVNPEQPDEVDVSRPSDAIGACAAAKSAFRSLFLGLAAGALLVGGVGSRT